MENSDGSETVYIETCESMKCTECFNKPSNDASHCDSSCTTKLNALQIIGNGSFQNSA